MTSRQLRAWRTSFKGPGGVTLTQVQAAKWWGCHVRTWRGYEGGRYYEGKLPKFLVTLCGVTTHLTVDNTFFRR